MSKVNSRRAFLIFLAFAVGMGVPNYIQYQLSPLGPQIMEMLSLTTGQFNSIFTALNFPPLFFSIISGLLVDRYGYKAILGFSIFLTCAGAWLRVFADTYALLFLAVMLSGFAMGFLTSNASKLLGQFFGAERSGMMMGFVLAISTSFVVIAMATTNILGMKASFVAAGILAAASLILWLLALPKAKKAQASAVPPVSLKKALAVSLKNRHIWISSVVAFCVYGAMSGMGSMVPTALQQGRGLSVAVADTAGTFLMIGNLVGGLILPALSMKVGKYRLPMMIAGVVCALGCGLGWMVPGGVLLYIAMLLTGMAIGGGMAQIMAVSIRLPNIGPVYAGTAGGVITTVMQLGGVLLPTYIASGLAGSNYGIYFAVFGVSSVIWVIGVYLMPKCLDGFAPAKKEEETC